MSKAIITRITPDKECKQVCMSELVPDDLFYMENTSGELISVSSDGDFILKATDNPTKRDNNYSINCYFIGDLNEIEA